MPSYLMIPAAPGNLCRSLEGEVPVIGLTFVPSPLRERARVRGKTSLTFGIHSSWVVPGQVLAT